MTGTRPVELAVVVIDVDDHPVAPGVIEALASGAGSGGEVIVVDARTTAGRAWLAAPRVRVVAGDPAATATELRLLGAETTASEAVGFVDGRARVCSGWAARMMESLRGSEETVAVSAASHEIGEPTATFTGNVGARHPLDVRTVHDVLYPVPEASVWRRAVVTGRGGIDSRLAWPVAVIDLAWRLRIRGGRILLDPDATVDTGCTCEIDVFGGLVAVHSCAGDDSVASILPAAMLVAAAREPAAVDRFIREAGSLARRRQEVQRQRVRSDEDVLDMFLAATEPGRGDGALDATYEDAVARHGLRGLFRARQRILIVTPDVLLRRMAGPAIRAWQIAAALAPHHLVHLVTTSGWSELESGAFEVSAPSDFELRELAMRADVVIAQGFAIEGRPYLASERHVLVVDLYDPLHLEQLELFRDADEDKRRVTVFEATRVLNEQLARGDFFVCASPKQRDFWLGQLAGVGRVNHATYDDDKNMRSLIDVVPFGLPDEEPSHRAPAMKGVVPGIGPGDEVILWGGGIYNWFDPLTLIRAVDRLRVRRPSVRLFFLGLRHPNPDVTEMRIATEARRLARELRLTDRFVFFNEGWVAYEERQNFLLEASIGVSTHFDHVETEFSFRTRILDYIWAALPIVATEGDWFAELISQEHLGVVVPPEDVDALEAALEKLLDDHTFAEECRDSLRRRRQDFRWSETLAPIVNFCSSPRRAPDLSDPRVRRHVWANEADRRAEWLRAQPSTLDRVRQMLS